MRPRGTCAALLGVSLLTLGTLAPVHAEAATVQGVRFEERVVLGEEASLDLCAAELLRYKRIFRGYVAALYLEDCGRRDAVLGDAPRRLELSYFWSIPGSLFGSAAEDVLARNLSPTELAALRDRLEALHAEYRDVDPGDRYALTYLPGIGTELSWNGTPLVTVPGEDFARAYFAIWLGDEPLDAGLRDRLLDGVGPSEG